MTKYKISAQYLSKLCLQCQITLDVNTTIVGCNMAVNEDYIIKSYPPPISTYT